MEVNQSQAFSAGYAAANQLIQDDNLPEVLTCATDQIAIGALHALNEAGIRIPEQVAVTGFDGIPTSKYVHPSLTTIQQPLAEVTAAAFQLVINKKKSKDLTFSGKLVVRNSTK